MGKDAEALRRAMQPATRKPIHEWAEGAIYFGTRQPTARQGWYRANLTPYMRGIFDALRDPSISEIVVKKSAQIGLTQAALVWLGYIVVEDPGPALVVTATGETADFTTEKRFIPMIEDSPALRAEVSAIKFPLQKRSQQFRRCAVDWVGAASPSQLASRPVRYLILDETNKYPLNMKDEGDTIELAIQRTKTFWNKKVLIMSTPTVAGGFISRRFDDGDRRTFLLPCPTCGHKQELKFDRLKFDASRHPDEAGAGAWYECANGCRIEHREKIAMMDAGEWTAQARASRAGIASFHTSSMYSPFITWADLVAKFLTVKDDPAKLQDFINSDLGQDWEEKVSQVSDEALREREAAYNLGTDPKDLPALAPIVKGLQSVVVAGVDVQKDHFWVVLRRYWFGGHSALIDFRKMFSFEEINRAVDSIPGEVWVGIDSGYDAERIYTACLEFKYIATKGASTAMGMPFTQTTINPYEGTRKQSDGASLELIVYDTDNAKRILSARQAGEGWGRWFIPANAPEEYRAQVTAERFNEGRAEWEIRPGRRHNHATDCECIADTIAKLAGYNVPERSPKG